MKTLDLGIRTSVVEVFKGAVERIRAEDRDGWFGIRPGRANLAAVLPPGLLLFEDEEGEGFVALAGGLLDLHDGRCRVIAREAVVSRRLEDLESELEKALRIRKEGPGLQRDVFEQLAKEALRRLRRQELDR